MARETFVYPENHRYIKKVVGLFSVVIKTDRKKVTLGRGEVYYVQQYYSKYQEKWTGFFNEVIVLPEDLPADAIIFDPKAGK